MNCAILSIQFTCSSEEAAVHWLHIYRFILRTQLGWNAFLMSYWKRRKRTATWCARRISVLLNVFILSNLEVENAAQVYCDGQQRINFAEIKVEGTFYGNHTERRGRVVTTPATCMVGSGFKSHPGDQVSWLRLFVVFLSHSRDMPGWYLELGHDRFLRYPF
jgi:hypothetical protein